jgi:uncharacterized protein (TIGR02453 family)
MAPASQFAGFPPATLKFLRALAKNNDRTWFEAHRAEFESEVMDPARDFINALGARLTRLAPMIVAEPRTDRSIFRLHRDVRFSKDKSPYKTHLGILLWDGAAPKMESAGFYLHVEPGQIFIGMGMHIFSKSALPAYREAVADKRRGAALARILAKLEKAGYGIGTQHYKRVPRGIDPEHPRADLLRHNGLHVEWKLKASEVIGSPALVNLCHSHFKAYAPLHRWLLELI